MTRFAVGMSIKHLVKDKWVELLFMPLEKPLPEGDEDLISDLENIMELFYKSDEKVKLGTENDMIIVRGMNTRPCIFKGIIVYETEI